MNQDANQPPQGQAPDATPALNVGDSIGGYTIAELISADAASAVWRAQDSEGKEHIVRQLIPGSPAATDRNFLSRCQKQVEKQQAIKGKAKRATMLDELIADPRGAFVVSSYIGGATVNQLLDSRPDPFDLVRALRIVHAVAKVLDTIHKNGLIHGGLRPGSIVLRMNGGVTVSDIGVTGLVAEQEALSPQAARYLAPELFHGVAGDAQSDIYSLGMIAYEMLAGRGAFEMAFNAVLSDPRGPAIRWMKWHTNARVSAPPLHEINPRVPVRLSDLVARMMAKDRTKRITSAEQLLMAIHRHFGSDAIDKAQVSPDAFTPSGAQISATGPGDTTELAPPSIWPRIITAAAIVAVVLAGVIWYAVGTMQDRAYRQLRNQSAESLEDADALYTAGSFDDALVIYEKQATDWPDPSDEFNLHGKAGAMLVKARIALQAGNLDEVQAQIEALDELGEAGPADRNAVKMLADEVARRRAFAASVETIEAQIQAGEYAQARTELEQARKAELTDDESQRLIDFQTRIDARLEADRVDQAIARAKELAGQGNIDQSISHLEDAQKALNNPRIDDLIDELTLRKDFVEAVKRGESAEESDKLPEAIRAFKEALAIREDGALSQRVSRLQSRVLVDQGKDRAEKGDQEGARQAFMSALSYDPGNAEARGWLTRMNVRIEKQSLLFEAMRAEAAGDLAQAAAHYRAALEHGDDPELEQTLRSLDVRIALNQAERFMVDGQLERAEALLLEAKELMPENPAVDDALTRYDRYARYEELVKTGDGHAENGRFAQAKQAYRRARDLFKTEEIAQRLDDTEFNHLMAQARGYIDTHQWASANSILDTAARIRVTDELTRLREQVKEAIQNQ